jgi:hypothetical protein
LLLSAAVLTAMLIGALPAHAQQIRKTMLRLPDTGQNHNFTPLAGEDSDHPSMPMGFVVQSGTVRDTVTGLMWQQVDGGEMTWAQARAYCDTLTLGGFSDWRLPIGHELFSIHDLSRGNPALPEAFTRTQAEYWWSSDTLVGDGRRIWCTNAGGGIGPHPMTETISAGGAKRFHVRAVRDVVQPSLIPAQFTENAVETIDDHITDRLWMQFCVPGSYTWEDALRTADTIRHAGYADWRVPNIKELQSLSVRSMKTPTTDMRFFPCVMPTGSYWSSTTLVNKTLTQAWILQSELGIATYAEKATSQGLILIRGGDRLVSVDDDDATRDVSASPNHVFPNPTNSRVHLGSVFERIRVFTTAGVEVRAAESAETVDLSGLVVGVYVLTCTDMQGMITTFTVWKY